jgi:tripartite-type tricarboxylate transporter receptor subunit TctC
LEICTIQASADQARQPRFRAADNKGSYVKYSGRRPSFLLSTIVLGLLSSLISRPAPAADWKPTRPINLIVPWAAGGSTDQITRLVASEMEKPLGQTIVIINQPGASGSIGTRSALEASKDGYTWAAGAAQDLGAYQTLGSLNSPITDWHLFLSVANVQVIGVGPNTPYRSAKELLDAMKAQPGKISVATAGVTSAGHNAMELIAKVAGVKYRHVTYDGGNPAVVATVAGETEVTTQLAVEEADMIRGKRLRPLATVSNKPLELDGYGTIPPLSDTLPGFSAPTNYFGIFIPKGVPDEVVAAVQKIWIENVSKSEVLKNYAVSRGALLAPVYGEAAQKAAFPAVQANAWLLFDSGKAKVSPDTVGIPRP